MASVIVWQDKVWAGYEAIVLGRVETRAGVNFTQAAVSSIAYTVREAEGDETQITTGTLVVATTIYDTLQTGGLWDADLTGYNFYGILPPTCFPTAGKRYRVKIEITPTVGNPVVIVHEATAVRAT